MSPVDKIQLDPEEIRCPVCGQAGKPIPDEHGTRIEHGQRYFSCRTKPVWIRPLPPV